MARHAAGQCVLQRLGLLETRGEPRGDEDQIAGVLHRESGVLGREDDARRGRVEPRARQRRARGGGAAARPVRGAGRRGPRPAETDRVRVWWGGAFRRPRLRRGILDAHQLAVERARHHDGDVALDLLGGRMRAKWLCLVALTAAAVGCGEGRAIFDIDVFSFLSGAKADTLPYVGPLPPGVPDTVPVQTVRSLGFGGSSVVDTVRFIGSVDFVNASGTGSVTFAVYFGSLKDTVYPGTPWFSVSAAVTPGATTPSPFDVDIIDPAMRRLFLASTVYVGIRVSATGAISGTAKLSALRARVVIQDKIF